METKRMDVHAKLGPDAASFANRALKRLERPVCERPPRRRGSGSAVKLLCRVPSSGPIRFAISMNNLQHYKTWIYLLYRAVCRPAECRRETLVRIVRCGAPSLGGKRRKGIGNLLCSSWYRCVGLRQKPLAVDHIDARRLVQ